MNPETVYRALHGHEQGGLTGTQRVVLVSILLGVVLAVVGSEPGLPADVQRLIELAELGVGGIFLVEYVARIWSIGVITEFSGLRGRIRYMTRPLVVVDLLALLPFLVGALGAESLILRLIRVMRLLALSRLVRYSDAMKIIVSSVVERRFELAFAMMLAGLMILISAAALYVVEGSYQPAAFGSIGRSMWWAVVTLTTVGYGDVFPQTALGKVFAAITALAGIAMIAMPTAILAAAFSDGFARARAARASQRQASRSEAPQEVEP